MRRSHQATIISILIMATGGSVRAQEAATAAPPDRRPAWRKVLAERFPAYGHRNWIVIADSAYPAQTRPGIETIVTHAGQLDVVRAVLEELKQVKHVRPDLMLDAELPYVPEADAPGIDTYRAELTRLLGARPGRSVPHEDILHILNEQGEFVRVLVLKTDLTLPYTSVFIRLDCGYWSEEAEQRLRAKMTREPRP